jgi:hypothetical protein
MFMDFWFLIGSLVILSINKDYVYILPTYVLLPIFCVDFFLEYCSLLTIVQKLYTSANG